MEEHVKQEDEQQERPCYGIMQNVSAAYTGIRGLGQHTMQAAPSLDVPLAEGLGQTEDANSYHRVTVQSARCFCVELPKKKKINSLY